MANIAKRQAAYLKPPLPTIGKIYPKKVPIAAAGVYVIGVPAKYEMPKGRSLSITGARVVKKPQSATKVCCTMANAICLLESFTV